MQSRGVVYSGNFLLRRRIGFSTSLKAQLIASSEKAVKVLGWKPQYNDLNTIVASAWAWHKSHPNGFEEG